MAPLPPKRPGQRQEVYEAIVVAQRLRTELGLRSREPVDCVLELAEERLGLDVILAPLRRGLSGFYVPARPRPLVLVQCEHPVARQRFTVAHEVGHHALGHAAAPRIHGEEDEPDGAEQTPAPPTGGPESVSTAADLAGHYRPQPSPDPQERAANAFAGELLIPSAGAARLAARWTDEPPLDRAVRLSAHYGVSAFSAAVRLQMAGLIDAAQMKSLRAQMAALEHIARYADLELPQLDDQLQRHDLAGGGPRYTPAARALLSRLRLEVDATAEPVESRPLRRPAIRPAPARRWLEVDATGQPVEP